MTPTILIKLQRLRFPDEGGRLQVAGDTGGLIKELASDYDRYHAFLAQRLEELGGDPDPADYRDRFEDYCRATADVTEIYIAETFLRQCVAAVQLGRDINAMEPAPAPLADERQRLVSQRTRMADESLRGQPPRKQAPCPFPVD